MLASRYAKMVLQDPDKLAAYAAKAVNGATPYILAMTDYLKPPFVQEIDTTGYHGNPGDKISVIAGDDFELTGVVVKISDSDGIVIEQGVCVLNTMNGNQDYTATTSVPDPEGFTITATATDTPGHTAELSVTL